MVCESKLLISARNPSCPKINPEIRKTKSVFKRDGYSLNQSGASTGIDTALTVILTHLLKDVAGPMTLSFPPGVNQASKHA